MNVRVRAYITSRVLGDSRAGSEGNVPEDTTRTALGKDPQLQRHRQDASKTWPPIASVWPTYQRLTVHPTSVLKLERPRCPRLRPTKRSKTKSQLITSGSKPGTVGEFGSFSGLERLGCEV